MNSDQMAGGSHTVGPFSSTTGPSNSRKGEEIAQLFQSRCTRLCTDIFEDVSVQQITECLAPLPQLKAEKVKAKFEEALVNRFNDKIHYLINEKVFLDKLNLLANLEDMAVSKTPAWRPTEDMDADTLYRPYRVQFLKEEIEKMEALVHTEEVSVNCLQTKLSKFLLTSNEIKANIISAKQDLNCVESKMQDSEASLNSKINDLRLSQMTPSQQ